MFITVHFGEADSLLFNPNCKNKVLLESIRQRCRCNGTDIIDLADEQAYVKRINDQPFDKYATDTLISRANYILIKVTVKTDETQSLRSYQPLLQGLELTNPDFINRLSNRKINPDAAPAKDLRDASRVMTSRAGRKENRLQTGVSLKSGKSGANLPPATEASGKSASRKTSVR